MPSSFRKNDCTCSGERFIMVQISLKFTHAVRVVPTRMTCGGFSFLRVLQIEDRRLTPSAGI